MESEFILLFSLAVVASLYGSVGHGGASGYLAILSLTAFAQHGPEWLKVHALCLNLIVASLALYNYSKQGFLNFPLIWPFIVTSIPAAYLGAYLPIIDWVYDTVLSLTLIWAAWRLVMLNKTGTKVEHSPPQLTTALPIGAGLGIISGIVGVGGGIFLSPLLILKKWAGAKETAAVSALFILVNSVAGLAGMSFSGQMSLDLTLLSKFIIAVLIGGLIGTHFGAAHGSETSIRRLLAVVLIIASFRRILGFVGL